MGVLIPLLSMVVCDTSPLKFTMIICLLTCLLKFTGQGNDFFDVLRNKCNMELDGESGNDVFIVRSFIDGSLEDQTLG